MKRLKTIISLILVVMIPLSFSVHAAVQPQISATETVTRIREVETLRDTNSETYLLSDGTYECVVYAEDKYYLDDSQSLRLIDNSIAEVDTATDITSRQYKNTANAFDVYFSDSGTPEVNIIYNENGISFTPAVTASKKGVQAKPERSVMTVGKVENCTTLNELTSTGSNTVVYKNAFRDTDLVYVLENSALKEYIILNSANAPNEFSFMFTLDNVTMKNADGNAYFTAADGTTIFALDSLFAVDANGAITENLIYSSAPVANTNEVLITVTLNKEYISSSNRAFPVIIDPTVMISSTETADACVCSYTPNTNYQMATQLRTGYEPDYGIRRSYIKFNIPSSVPANCVTNATLDIEKLSGVAPTIRAYRCLSSWSSGTITWNNMPSFTAVYPSTASTEYREGSTWYTMNVTEVVSRWVDGSRPNFGFVIKDLTEDDPDHWTTLYSSDAPSPHKPELHITYSNASDNNDEGDDTYFLALENIYGFTTGEATLIMKLYSQVTNKFSSNSIYYNAWISSRLLGGMIYGNSASLSGSLSSFKWQDVAGSVFSGDEASYYTNTLGFTLSEYMQLKNILQNQHNNASYQNKGDFAHMQISLAARLACYLDIDGLASNIAGDDETISYLAGWLGDATLLTNGTTSFGNDDYIADLDAENIYRQIIQGRSITLASECYFSDLYTSTRAEIFTNYISYETIEYKVYYELIDKNIYYQIDMAAAEGDVISVKILQGLLEDEEYHQEMILTNYPDTYDFLYSVYNELNVLGDY